MKNLGIILGVIAFFAIVYFFFQNKKKTDTSNSNAAKRLGGDGEVADGETPTSPYTCTVTDSWGRQRTITSPDNSLWFQQICSGLQPYTYSNVVYYSPVWWANRGIWWRGGRHWGGGGHGGWGGGGGHRGGGRR